MKEDFPGKKLSASFRKKVGGMSDYLVILEIQAKIPNWKSKIDRTHKKIGAIPVIPRITPIIDFKL